MSLRPLTRDGSRPKSEREMGNREARQHKELTERGEYQKRNPDAARRRK